MKKVVPSERLRHELDDVLTGVGEEAGSGRGGRAARRPSDPSAGARGRGHGVRGRARYERADGGEEVIYRNGFPEPSTVSTTSGPAVIERPRVRDASRVGFASQVLGKGVARRTRWRR